MSAYKGYGQQTIWDERMREHSKKECRKTAFLSELEEWLNFEQFRPLLETEFRAHALGQSSYDPLVLFKVMLLQKWYDLSDPDVEELLYDRMSFRDFLGLGLDDTVPDETTICLFRKRLKESGLYEKLFTQVNTLLSERGLLLKTGAIVDATFVKAPKGKKQDGTPSDSGADYGHKGHGYSVHVNATLDTLITQLEVTSARPHDSQHISDVLTGEETALYADSAYGSGEYRETLQELDIEDHILEKAQKNKELTKEQKASNRTKSRIRSRVEHVFGHWKLRHGFEQVRYNNLRANRLDAFFHAIAHNLRRGLFLSKNGLYTRPCSV
jgi:transposase, IS5 family